MKNTVAYAATLLCGTSAFLASDVTNNVTGGNTSDVSGEDRPRTLGPLAVPGSLLALGVAGLVSSLIVALQAPDTPKPQLTVLAAPFNAAQPTSTHVTDSSSNDDVNTNGMPKTCQKPNTTEECPEGFFCSRFLVCLAQAKAGEKCNSNVECLSPLQCSTSSVCTV